jgi:hypothetical protein
MADIVIINPRFDISFWGMGCSARGQAHHAGRLPAVAGRLTPAAHDIT